jgi:hypothetical protein
MTTQWVLNGEEGMQPLPTRKPVSDFRENPRLSSGLDSWCRACRRQATRTSWEKNREDYNAARRKPTLRRVCALTECEEEFDTSHEDRRYCCERHQRIDANRRYRARTS